MSFTPELIELPEGRRDGYNATGTDIPANLCVVGSYAAIALPAANTDLFVGVTRSLATNGYRTSLCNRGIVPVIAGSGGVTAGQRLTMEAATGKVVPLAPATGVNQTLVGWATTTAAANATALVELAGPGAQIQG